MNSPNQLCFKIADAEAEFRQIRELNYRTFVREIPQHQPNSEESLRDRFEEETVYCICLRGSQLVGMIALRSQRPFSLDQKLDNLDALLPAHNSACEIRLLAIPPQHRHGRILAGLCMLVYEYFETRGHDLGILSGTPRQVKLYRHFGFAPFGPVVGTPEAPYQPMYQTMSHFLRLARKMNRPMFRTLTRGKTNLLPGPIHLTTQVRAALGAKPISHRNQRFADILARARESLLQLTGAADVAVAMGTGTLANDLVAGQIAQLPGRGLILCHGEFGRRLVDHATRFQLDFDLLELPWGEAFTGDMLADALSKGEAKTWIWSVHAETSTGILNDLEALKALAQRFECKLCLDCISSLGNVPCDLRGVALASGVSGKGLRSLAGLSLVFHDRNLPPARRPLPRSLDLSLYANGAIPFTLSSNLVTALKISLEDLEPARRFREVREKTQWARQALREAEIPFLGDEDSCFPGVITIPLPPHVDAGTLGMSLEEKGWILSSHSQYLQERNWVQICFFGPADIEDLPPMIRRLARVIHSVTP